MIAVVVFFSFMSDIESLQLRKVLGQYPTGITVVTTTDSSGNPVGMTANSFASVSLAPPLILWSVDVEGSAHEVFTQADHFCVHFLSEDQEALSTLFSSSEVERFDKLEWTFGELGSPMLPECLSRIQCAKEAVYPGGDHSIILGRVICLEDSSDKKPLVYHQGKYSRLESC